MFPNSVLVVGCGLMGTSVALAIQERHPHTAVDGVETSHHHRREAVELRAFRHVFSELPDSSYDLVILAVPIDAACGLLLRVARQATLVMDICSVKKPICEQALASGLDSKRFVPTHPMAGSAEKGPRAASATLFVNQPWILLRGWNEHLWVSDWLASLGARIEWVDSAEEHDTAMAAVSHGIHIMSVAAMTASENLKSVCSSDSEWQRLTGPGFRDITRLSQSPHDFWVKTLLSNRANASQYVRLAIRALEQIEGYLNDSDPQGLETMLKTAKQMKDTWVKEM